MSAAAPSTSTTPRLPSTLRSAPALERGAVVESPGTVTAVSTLFWRKLAPVDYSGAISATDSLFQTAPVDGTLSGSGNLVGVDPLLDTNGLQNNGGPTQTIALQAGSPAIGAGANSDNLFADQRGYAPRTGPGGTDIGAYETNAQGDTQAPTATLNAVTVTNANASALNPYTFTVTYSDNVAVALSTLSNAEVQVLPPGSVGAPTHRECAEPAQRCGWHDGRHRQCPVLRRDLPDHASGRFLDAGRYRHLHLGRISRRHGHQIWPAIPWHRDRWERFPFISISR